MGVIRRCENCGRNSEWGKNLWIVGNGYVDGGVVGNEIILQTPTDLWYLIKKIQSTKKKK